MRQDVITSFKEGHRVIMAVISQLQQVVRSYPRAKPRLRELNDLLMAHFSRQDQQFFKRLSDYYEGDRESMKMLEFLSLDAKDIKIKYLTFADKHSGELGDRAARSFPRDFTDFTQAIMARIQMEEEYLFPLLKKMDAQEKQK